MAEATSPMITVTTQPTPTQRDQVLALIERSRPIDGHAAVNEAGLLALRHAVNAGEPAASVGSLDASDAGKPGESTSSERPSLHALASDPRSGDVVGYAQAVWEESGPVAALVVDLEHRRRGIGAALWRALADRVDVPLRVWATGNSEAARALAASQGLAAVRTLLVLGRSLTGELPPTDLPPGFRFRTFRPGQDEQPWLEVNARAFAGHPEQGSMTREDLVQRMAEPWFDPDGFFLVVPEADDRVVGFHWTKREPGSDNGEVYVIGVDPTAGVRGLGTALLGVGLRHLRAAGATFVDLYVEADNERALALYRRFGFAPVSADVMYTVPAALPDVSG